ncbi:MAG TPA: ParB N-terminal domain-containing protein [Vulgatibacter sp.]
MAPPLKPLRELAYVPLADVVADTTFRLRHAGDVSSLARSIAQVGQLFPVEVREVEGGVQALTGFRRLEALRLLQRNRVLVRNHGPLADDAAAVVAAADAIDNRSLDLEDLRELHERYVAMGWGTPALLELVSRSIEKEGERLEDLAARLRGEAPPDRTIEDEDALDDDEREPAPSQPAAFAAPGSPGASAVAPVVGPPGSGGAGADGSTAIGWTSVEADASPAPGASGAGLTPSPAVGPPRPAVDPADPALGTADPKSEGALERTRLRMPVVLAPLPVDPPAAPRLDVAEKEAHASGVTADSLARQLAERLSEATQDLSLLAEHWNAVPSGLRVILADQLDYYRRLASWLGPQDGDEP